MQKIMFDDRFGLTRAVLEGRKTMTRRIISEKLLERAHDYMNSVHGTGIDMHEYLFHYSPYKALEVVAVAQRYKELLDEFGGGRISPLVAKAGYMNKMFVRADLMPHQIQINGYHVERLQDISDEDCLKEGIIEYASCCECGSELYAFDGADDAWYTPREAFAALIKKMLGRKVWDDNPWTFAYDFTRIK